MCRRPRRAVVLGRRRHFGVSSAFVPVFPGGLFGTEVFQGQRATAELSQQSCRRVSVGNGQLRILNGARLDLQTPDVEVSEGELLKQHDFDGIAWTPGILQQFVSINFEGMGVNAD